MTKTGKKVTSNFEVTFFYMYNQIILSYQIRSKELMLSEF